MKLKLIPLLLLVSSGLCFSQRIEVTKGPIIDKQKIMSQLERPLVQVYVGAPVAYSTTLFFNNQTRKTYFGMGLRGKSYQFIVLDNYVKFGEVKKLTAELEQEKVQLISFEMINNKMYVFYGVEYSELDEITVYVNEVSSEMVVLGSPIIIQNYKNVKMSGKNFRLSASQNNKNFLITRLLDVKDGEKAKLHCKLINESFGEVWNKEIELEKSKEYIHFKYWKVDNSGNYYLLTQFADKRLIKTVLYSYFWKTKSFKAHDVGLNTGENFGSCIEILNGESPYIIGLNHTGESVKSFVNKVNVELENVELLSSNPMSNDFHQSSKYRGYDIKDWSISNMVFLENNTIVTSIEADPKSMKNGWWFTYNAFVLGFGNDGVFKWSHTVFKKQNSMIEMVGHALLPAGNNVLFVFNDQPENLRKKINDKKVKIYTGVKKGMPIVHEIDEKGKVIKYALTTDKELENYSLNMYDIDRIQDDLFFVPAINIKGFSGTDSRNLTLKINK